MWYFILITLENLLHAEFDFHYIGEYLETYRQTSNIIKLGNKILIIQM